MAVSDSIILRLSVLELRRLRDCAEREMHAGHWGSSDIIIPEYDYLYHMLQSAEDMLEMRIPYVRILVGWLAEATGYGSVLLREDESILRKLDSALVEFRADILSEQNALHASIARIERDIHRLQGREVPNEPSIPFRPDPVPVKESIVMPAHEACAVTVKRRSFVAIIRNVVHGKVIDPSDAGSLPERIGDAVRRFAVRCKEIISGTPEPDMDQKPDATDAASYLKRTGKAVRTLRKKGGW